MILKWGTYAHEIDEAEVTITRTPWLSDKGERVGYDERWQVGGLLLGTSIADLTTKIDTLVTAYSTDQKDLKLLQNDGASTTSHQLLTATSLGGTRVTSGPSFPEWRGAEYATMRRFEVTIEARYQDAGAPATLAFVESLSFSGGGPQVVHLETLTGLPQKQKVRRHTVYHASQSGTAIGRTTWPTVPSAVWPSALVGKPRITRRSPKRVGPAGQPNLVEFQVDWEYQFESAVRLTGNPGTP